jgi:MoxR-like ATPase
MSEWYVFRGPQKDLPSPPPWRRFGGEIRLCADPERSKLPEPTPHQRRRGESFIASDLEIEMVNAALVLRRPLLVTGKPGTGKSSLAYAVANDLQLGPVLHWSVTSRTSVKEGLYSYDILARLHDQQMNPTQRPDITSYLRLGPVGTALIPSNRPRVLLIDEIDKGDIDLPNDLLHVFEEGRFNIQELARLSENLVEVQTADAGHWVPILHGEVQCREFPLVILTSNGDRDFPPAFLRRCLRLNLPEPSISKLAGIIDNHLGEERSPDIEERWKTLIAHFEEARKNDEIATDQLLNALYICAVGAPLTVDSALEGRRLVEALLKPLSST